MAVPTLLETQIDAHDADNTTPGTLSFTVSQPAVGELMILVGSTSGSGTNAISLPAGWSELIKFTGLDGGPTNLQFFYRFAEAGEPTTFDFSLQNQFVHGKGTFMRWGDAANPFDGATPLSIGNQTDDAAVLAPAITPTSTESVSLYVAGGWRSGATFTPPAELTLITHNNSLGQISQTVAYEAIGSDGGDKAFVCSPSWHNSFYGASFTISGSRFEPLGGEVGAWIPTISGDNDAGDLV